MPKSIKKIFSRIITKHDLEVNWLRNSNFVPLQGELIIYDCEVDAAGNTLDIPSSRSVPYTYERLKLGDGFTSVNDLPFIDGSILTDGELDVNSTKPVQNKVIATAITDINSRIGTTPVATQISDAIASQQHFSGDYSDLTNAPVLPECVSDLEDDLGIATTAYVDLVKKEIPTLISQLENDSNYVNDTDLQTVKESIPDISNLVNKEYVDNMFSAVPKFEVMVVEALPTENISSTTVYLLKSDESVDSLYDEYIYVNSTWELLGSAKINLDDYAKTENVPTKVSQLENDSNFTSEAQVEALYKKLNSNTVLGFYCIEDVTVVVDGISTTYPANSNVEIKLLETDTFEIIPTSDNSILTLTAFPGALGTYYSWLEGVKQFSNILFDMNSEDMYVKWNQGNQGAYQVQYAQYLNCIFWSDNPYIAELSKRTNYTLYYSAQLPLCYSTIPDNTFKAFYLAFGVNSDPNWGNKAYRDSFANANWATQVFSYYGARTIGIFGHDDTDFNIILPPDCRGLMSAATAIENAGTFDAINVTNFGAKSGSWRDAFGWCSSLRNLYIKNLKVNLNISWSPINYDSIYFIISEATNTSKITISVSPYTYNLLSQSDFDLATSKNITIELITTNYTEDRRLSAIANKADREEVLLKTEQTLSNEELDQVRKNLKFIGKNVEGQTFNIDGTDVVAAASAEIFGDYENNIAVGQWSIAEGCTTVAKGKVAHAEGAFTKALADGAHTEGYGTEASGYWSHAEGEYTKVTSYASHAEGSYTKMPDGSTRYSTAAGYASHTEGGGCHTTGVASHAEGIGTTANGRCAHVEGIYTIASGKAQHVEGIANIEDAADTYIHIAGNGEWDARSNAHTLDWQGNAWFAGDVYVGSTSGINKDEGSKRLITADDVATPDWNAPEGAPGHVLNRTHWSEEVELLPETTFIYMPDESSAMCDNILEFIEGTNYTVTWNGVVYTTTCRKLFDTMPALGNVDLFTESGDTGEPFVIVSGEEAMATLALPLDGSTDIVVSIVGERVEKIPSKYLPAFNFVNGSAMGSVRSTWAKAENAEYSLGDFAFAEGYNTVASGSSSHAEGDSTTASDDCAHAEGYGTKAAAWWSHAEGVETTAYGLSSHAEGNGTIASGNCQHVQGRYNISDTTSAHIIGNGNASGTPSNAHTLDWSGNAWFSGDVYVGSTSGKNKDEGSVRLARIDEIPDTTTFATKEALDTKADKSEIPSLTGLATEEYVDTAISNLASGNGITLQRLTQEEYDLIEKDPNTLYIIV